MTVFLSNPRLLGINRKSKNGFFYITAVLQEIELALGFICRKVSGKEGKTRFVIDRRDDSR